MLRKIYLNLINASDGLSAKKLSWIFLALAVLQAMFLIAATPPFQTADATAHFFRAYQLWDRAPLTTANGSVGAEIDTGIMDLYRSVDGIFFNYQTKFTHDRYVMAKSAKETGIKGHLAFPNTAQYSFLGYMPQISVLYATRGEHRKIWDLYNLMCGANAFAAILLTFFAIRLGGVVAPIIFAVGILPETLSLYASVSQDASLISMSLLLCALLARSISLSRYEPLTIGGIITLGFLIATGRPPYIALLLAIFCSQVVFSRTESIRSNWRNKVIAFSGTSVAGLAVALTCIISAGGGIKVEGVDPKQQLMFVIENPASLPRIVINTFKWHSGDILHTMIGDFGWLDAPLPNSAVYAGALLIAASFLVAALDPSSLSRKKNFFPIIAALSCAAGISFAQYITWTKVGEPAVFGIAGRYILPILPFAGISISALGLCVKKIDLRPVVAIFKFLVIGIPFVLAYQTIECILLRYYI